MEEKALSKNFFESFKYAEKVIVSKALLNSLKIKIVLFCFTPFNA